MGDAEGTDIVKQDLGEQIVWTRGESEGDDDARCRRHGASLASQR